MHCPYCTQKDTRVVDSRKAAEGGAIRRRRECSRCGKRFTTYETVEASRLWVTKRNGTREKFDSEKMLQGLDRACAHRQIPIEQLEQAVQTVEQEIRKRYGREVSSTQIGEMLLERLAEIDEVAYIRFASVYRKFPDLESFMEALEELRRRRQMRQEAK